MFRNLFIKSAKNSAKNAPVIENLEGRTYMSAVIAHVEAGPTHLEQMHSHATVVSHKHENHVAKTSHIKATSIDSHIKVGDLPGVTDCVVYQQDFSGNPLFAPGGPSIKDIHQGYIGDCYFMSALGEEAARNPKRIEDLCRDNGDGTYDVLFHNNTGWVDEHVDGNLPVDGNCNLVYARLGQDGCIWVAIMEKAFCYFRASENNVWASYSAIDGTYDITEGLSALGLGANLIDPSQFNGSVQGGTFLSQMLKKKYDVLLATDDNAGPLVNDHCYVVVATRKSAKGWQIEVRNPWGTTDAGGMYVWVTATKVFPQMDQIAVAIA